MTGTISRGRAASAASGDRVRNHPSRIAPETPDDGLAVRETRQDFGCRSAVDQLLGGKRPQRRERLGVVALDAQRARIGDRAMFGFVEQGQRQDRLACRGHARRLQDRALEQAARQPRDHVRHDRTAAGRFAEERHLLRIAAEQRDVALDPLQRGELIQIAIVAARIAGRFPGQRRMGKEAEAAHAVIHADDDDALGGQRVGGILRRVSVHQRAAMDPDHHRQGRVRCRGRPPDVQRQAVLRLGQIVGLHAGGAERSRIEHRRPGLDRLRHPPAQFSDRRRGIGNALEADDAVGFDAAHRAAVDDHMCRTGQGGGRCEKYQRKGRADPETETPPHGTTLSKDDGLCLKN